MHALVFENDAVTAMFIEDELHDFGYSSVDTASAQQEAHYLGCEEKLRRWQKITPARDDRRGFQSELMAVS